MAQIDINNLQAVDWKADAVTTPHQATAGQEQVFVGFGDFGNSTLSVEHLPAGSNTWSPVALLTVNGVATYTATTGMYRIKLSGATGGTTNVSGFIAQVHGPRA
ncbi:MAG: hypothetical protein ABW176_13045 [Candidatus Thiodiazotropha endolucinida]